jgi:hypothetical protein
MVRDGSDNGHNPPDEPRRVPPPGQTPDSLLGAANLTQELAQLLAASIAQNRAARGQPLPTGSELASLASLVAASQRSLAPAFKDGLSALSYAHAPASPQAADAPDHGELHHDDEPMPIPSTWRQPTPNDDDRWFRQQVGAAVLGLAAGLMIVVPTVLWLSGWFGGPQVKGTSPAAPKVADTRASTEIKTVKVQVRPVDKSETAAQYVTGSVDPRGAAEAARPIEKAPAPVEIKAPAAAEPRSRPDDLLQLVARRIESGDVMGAREMLAGAESGSQAGAASFALAETYDPNMLAAWGTRGVSADVARARALYRKALDLGVSRAQARIDALK